MTWRLTPDQSAVSEVHVLNFNLAIRHDAKLCVSFPSDDLIAQVDDSELSKLTTNSFYV